MPAKQNLTLLGRAMGFRFAALEADERVVMEATSATWEIHTCTNIAMI